MTFFPKTMVVVLAFLAIAACPVRSMANDNGLYASAPPPGSSFVRFVNGSGNTLKGSIRGKESSSLSSGHAGPYVAVPQGDAAITFGAGNTNYTLKPGAHYSAVLANGKLSSLEEPANDNKLKTQLVLINVSKETNISLKTADGSTSVVDGVASGALGARAVNPIKTGLAVYNGNDKVADLGEQLLERGASYSIVVYDGAKGPAVNYDKAAGS